MPGREQASDGPCRYRRVVAGVVLGIAWHEPKSIDLPDDIRTRAGFVIVTIGARVTLWQLAMQRRQLAEQKDVLKDEVERNKKRDALVAQDGRMSRPPRGGRSRSQVSGPASHSWTWRA